MSSPTRVYLGVGGAIFATSSLLMAPGYRSDYRHEAETDSINAAIATAFLDDLHETTAELGDLIDVSNEEVGNLYIEAGPACLLKMKPWIGSADDLPEGIACDLENEAFTDLEYRILDAEADNRHLRSFVEPDVYSWLPKTQLEMAVDSAQAVVQDARQHSVGEELFDLETYDLTHPFTIRDGSVETVYYEDDPFGVNVFADLGPRMITSAIVGFLAALTVKRRPPQPAQ